MDHLKMPEAASGFGVEREHTFREEIRARSMAAVPIVVGVADWDVHDAARQVRRERRPRIILPRAVPGAVQPRVVAELAGARNQIENPELFSGARVESPDGP